MRLKSDRFATKFRNANLKLRDGNYLRLREPPMVAFFVASCSSAWFKTRPKPDRFQTETGGVAKPTRFPPKKRAFVEQVAKNFPIHCTELNRNEQK
jgi:hypothetical protein